VLKYRNKNLRDKFKFSVRHYGFFYTCAVEIKREVAGKIKVVYPVVFSCDLVNKKKTLWQKYILVNLTFIGPCNAILFL